MRGLIILVLVVATAWAGYWVVGSTAQKTAIEGWLEQQRAAGWTAEAEDLTVTGFPNRFDTILTDLELANPDAKWGWQAPSFQMLSLSYKPNHIIAVWPGEHIVTTPTDEIAINSGVMRGSVILKPDAALSLARVQMEIEDLVAIGADGWQATAAKASVAFFAAPSATTDTDTYDLYVRAEDFTLPTSWRGSTTQASALPAEIPEALLDATLTFDRPWDRFAVERHTPKLTNLRIRDMRFIWGALELRGTGAITINDAGYADGKFTIQARNWRDVLQVALAAEVINADTFKILEKGLSLLAQTAGNPETIEIPLKFTKNRTQIGILPIGPAPRFYR